MRYPLAPFPKPRPRVVNGHAYVPDGYKKWKRDAGKLRMRVGPTPTLIFTIQMPASWSEAKKQRMEGKPHQSAPDVDNLVKSVLDACLENDSGVWTLFATKIWGREGSIQIGDLATGGADIDWLHLTGR